VGHLARLIEEAGIPTVAVYVRAFRHVAEAMRVPRVVITRHPMGRTLGAPHDAERQREVLASALDLLETATSPTMIELPAAYRTGDWR
jgi:hypothetical protein